MPSSHAKLWRLDPSVDYLNHGAYGACPIAVLERQQELRDRLEREPFQFLSREFQPLLDRSRERLAELVGSEPQNLAFIANTTTGISAIIRSLQLQPEDEILITSHGYNACNNAVRAAADRDGATVCIAELPFPVASSDEVIAAVINAVSEKTRVALIDHVTSATGMILPVEILTRELQERGIEVIIDGAHAPGMIPLDLNSLGADYYVANCHKWLCGPKGSAFIVVPTHRQADFFPGVISHGWNHPRPGRTRFSDLMDWPGTFDPTPWACVADAIEFLDNLLPGGIGALMAHNSDLALAGRKAIAEHLGIGLPVPDEMIGSLATLPLPDDLSPQPCFDTTTTPTPTPQFQVDLFEIHRIEVPVFFFPAFPHRAIRISAQIYNDLDQYRRLAECLAQLLGADAK